MITVRAINHKLRGLIGMEYLQYKVTIWIESKNWNKKYFYSECLFMDIQAHTYILTDIYIYTRVDLYLLE